MLRDGAELRTRIFKDVTAASADGAQALDRAWLLNYPIDGEQSAVERAWARQLIERRLHQTRFRTLVLAAYGHKCAICGLPEPSLLDAAHIRRDKDPNGQPLAPNTLSLVSIHHR